MVGIESLLQVYCPGMAVRLLRPDEIDHNLPYFFSILISRHTMDRNKFSSTAYSSRISYHHGCKERQPLRWIFDSAICKSATPNHEYVRSGRIFVARLRYNIIALFTFVIPQAHEE